MVTLTLVSGRTSTERGSRVRKTGVADAVKHAAVRLRPLGVHICGRHRVGTLESVRHEPASALSRTASARRCTDSRRSRSGAWPVGGNVVPGRGAPLMRRSSSGIHVAAPRPDAFICPSWATAACGTPKPRKAPAHRVVGVSRRPRPRRTFGHLVGAGGVDRDSARDNGGAVGAVSARVGHARSHCAASTLAVLRRAGLDSAS